ncbi:uncharacterized protein LOC117639062 [Thrips palmi]|uniref:Uncharacterized protein LOC117639062 n=1 Tax=Thrips palmi TaxID=161013 RepID=A0A6P8ZGL7_THRPL|nr:uncharacterized protein LOC117639062 [Thrips palmi]
MSDQKVKTLTAKQQKNTISGKKGGKGCNRNVRHVLAKPYSRFWPLVDKDVELEVNSLLERLLPAARKPISADDCKLLRGMQGKSRKDARNELTKKIWERNPQASILRNFLVLGINDVSRSLEENTLASLLISNEADPPILTQHLATLAASRNVPHIVLQHLKGTMKKSVDFPSLAVGLKKVVAEDNDNYFHLVHLKIVSVFKTIVTPMLPDLPIEETVSENLQDCPPVVTKVKARSPVNIYLTRSSSKYRAFIPGKGLQVGSDSSWSPYISLSNLEKMDPAIPATQTPKKILGSTVVPEAKSFLQRVRDAKKAVIQPPSQEMPTGSFLSLSDNGDANEVIEAREEKLPVHTDKAPKPVKRYFSSLEPLKVKRMQGNPEKKKKKKKSKM